MTDAQVWVLLIWGLLLITVVVVLWAAEKFL